MEYLFFGLGIIYFLVAGAGIIVTAIVELLLTIILSTYWSIKDVISKNKN